MPWGRKDAGMLVIAVLVGDAVLKDSRLGEFCSSGEMILPRNTPAPPNPQVESSRLGLDEGTLFSRNTCPARRAHRLDPKLGC